MTDQPTMPSGLSASPGPIPLGLHLELLEGECLDTAAAVRRAVAGHPQGSTTFLTTMAAGLEQAAGRLLTAWRELYPVAATAWPTVSGSIPNEGKTFSAPLLKAVSFEIEGTLTPRGVQMIEQMVAATADPEPEPMPDAEGLAAVTPDHAFVMRPGGPVEDGCWHYFESGRKCMAEKDDHPARAAAWPDAPGRAAAFPHARRPVTDFELLRMDAADAAAAWTRAPRAAQAPAPGGDQVVGLHPDLMADLEASIAAAKAARKRHLRKGTKVSVKADHPVCGGLGGTVAVGGPNSAGRVLVAIDGDRHHLTLSIARDDLEVPLQAGDRVAHRDDSDEVWRVAEVLDDGRLILGDGHPAGDRSGPLLPEGWGRVE